MKEKFLLLIFIILLISCNNNEVAESDIQQYNWEVSTPEALNIDQVKINKAFSKASELNYLYSIVVIRHGKIAEEIYFNGNNKDSYYKIKSVSKSFLSAAYGIALDKSILLINDNLTEIVDDYNSVIKDDRFHQVTISHLLQMKAGLDSDINIYSTMVNSTNWLSTVFSMNLVNYPGTKFVYSTPGTHLLSAALTKASGMSSLQYVSTFLLEPMKVGIHGWEQDPQGVYFGGNNMYFTTRNMAVLGLLFLNNGKLNDIQIVPEKWVEKSLTNYSGVIGDWGVLKDLGYGYLWWLGKINDLKVFMAIGHGGQYVICVPSLDLIIATNSHSEIWWEEANAQELAILNLIGTYIIPAVN